MEVGGGESPIVSSGQEKKKRKTPAERSELQKKQEKIVIAYKILKGFDKDDKLWDRIHWARCARSAKLLLEVFGDVGPAWECLFNVSSNFESKGLSWTLETIIKHAMEWKMKCEKK